MRRLNDAATQVVLIGGQAVAFWAQYYSLTDEPLTSKDIDFCGDKAAARLCAKRLCGTPSFPAMDDPTPQSAIVRFVDDDGIPRVLDFLDAPYGLRAPEVRRLAQEFSVLDPEGKDTGVHFRVMHPLHCLTSRVSNTANLPGYATPHALRQLRFSVEIMRKFIDEVLAGDETRAALRLIKRVHHLSIQNPALTVFEQHQVDVFAIVPAEAPQLPQEYASQHYPQMAKSVRDRRVRFGRTPMPRSSRK